jgi:hypothetical protein
LKIINIQNQKVEESQFINGLVFSANFYGKPLPPGKVKFLILGNIWTQTTVTLKISKKIISTESMEWYILLFILYLFIDIGIRNILIF